MLGTIGAVTLNIGILDTIAAEQGGKIDQAWFHRSDAVITGLATGGGAKPVHDLLTRIRLPVPKP